MANKKKRNKKYRGNDSVQTPATIKVSAPNRSKPAQWFHENRQQVAIRLFQLVLILLVGATTYFIVF